MVYLVSCSQTLWLHEATQTISVMVKRREREGREEGEEGNSQIVIWYRERAMLAFS